MALSKEFRIQLVNKENLQFYYPGDILKGQVILNLKKPIDVQNISIKLSGTVEGVNSKVTLIKKAELLVQPENGEKYIQLDNNQQHAFDFEITIPTDLQLPSSVNIPKVGKIAYYLTATHKKPIFKLSPSLSDVVEQVEIMDIIDIDLPNYRVPVKMKNDLGFISGGKLTQWVCSIPRSAFARGDSIAVECSMNNFPAMDRKKAIKASLLRQVHKTSTGKIIECKVLSSRAIDLHVSNDITSSQSVTITLDIPTHTPPSVFPDTGRNLSVSYLIQAELNMKGIKSTIKFKSSYKQEIIIVIGTFASTTQSGPCCAYPPSYNESSSVIVQSPNLSRVSLQNLAVGDSSRIQVPMDSGQSIRSSSDIERRFSSDIPSIRGIRRNTLQQQFSSEFSDIKPLPKLEETEELNSSKSYLPPYRRLTNTTLSSSEASFSSKLTGPTESRSTPSAPSVALTSSSYQEAFDDYLPATPVHDLPRQDSTKTSVTNSHLTRELTTEPSAPVINDENEPSCDVRNNSYSNRIHCKKSNRPLMLSPSSSSQDVHIITLPPHEIGPDDIINKQERIVSEKPSQTKIYHYTEFEKESQSSTPPSLLFRQDTISTASSAGLVDDPFVNITAAAYPH